VKTEPSSTLPASSEGTTGSREPTADLRAPAANSGPTSVREPRQDGNASGPLPPGTLDFALLRGALEEIPFGVATTRGETILYANDALTRIFGMPQGALENRSVASLFDSATYLRISRRLEDDRVFDGRVRTQTIDGRPLDGELHVEWYSGGGGSAGGFLVLRDVSTELSSLGRLVDQLGGATFRIRVGDPGRPGRAGAPFDIEFVSPGIDRLTGIDASTIAQRPVQLTAMVSADERERLIFLYRRIVRGELPSATAQVSLRRLDGTRRVIQIRATGRRDTAGVVRGIDGVVTDAVREAELRAEAAAGVQVVAAPPARDAVAPSLMELSHEMLREASQQVHALTREIRGMRTMLRTQGGSMPAEVREELTRRLDNMTAAASSAASLNRGARRALTGTSTMGATLGEVLENVRNTLTPVVGERLLSVQAGETESVLIEDHVDELGTALIYLGLRAFRFSGSGSLRITAVRSAGADSVRGWSRSPRPAEDMVTIEIMGSAPPEISETPTDISSDMLRTIPRPAETDLAYQAACTLVGVAGGSIESDDATFTTARSVVKLRG
jgi:PAS domain S-box-containing protein